MFINIKINKGAIQRGQQDKGLKHIYICALALDMSQVPHGYKRQLISVHKLSLDGWQEEWWFHKSRVGLAIEDVVGGRQ